MTGGEEEDHTNSEHDHEAHVTGGEEETTPTANMTMRPM